jgi:hypothetical protein
MTTVQNIIKTATGGVPSTMSVLIELIDSSGSTPQGFVDLNKSSLTDYATDYTINTTGTVTPNPSTGAWTCDLTPNLVGAIGSANTNISIDTDSPASTGEATKYRITETANAIARTYTIIVPSSGGPYWIGDLLG